MNRVAPAHVVLVDMQVDATEIRNATAFSAFQRSRVPGSEDGTLDASRVVVLASPDVIRANVDALAKIVSAQSVEKVVCVIRGSSGRYDAVLHLPAELDLAPVAAIWVDDACGVVWAMGAAKARALTVYNDDANGDGAFALLVDALRIPQVFDDAFAKVKDLGTLVSPALRAFVPGATDAALNESAEMGAVTALTSGGRPNLEMSMDHIPSDLDSRASLFGNAPVPSEFFDAHGKIGSLSREIDERLREVDAAVFEITQRTPLTYRRIERANNAMRAVGESLRGLKVELVRLFNDIDGSNSLDANEVKKLRSAGLRSGSTRAASSEEPEAAEDLLRKHTLNELRRTRSLKELVSDLRHVEERATPRNVEEALKLLEEAAPDSTINGIRIHPPLRVPIGDWRSLAIIFAMFVAAGSTWPGSWILMLLLLSALYLFFFFVTHPVSDIRQMSWDRIKGISSSQHAYMIGGSVALGLAVGFSVEHAMHGIAVHVAGTLVALGAFALLARYAWRTASRRWLEAADLGGARDAGQRMLEVTAKVAMNDWILAEPRVRFARIAGKLAASLEALRVALLADLAPGVARTDAETPLTDILPSRTKTEAHEPSDVTPRLACNPAIRADLADVGGGALYKHSAILEEIVLDDYLDAISAGVDEHWHQIVLADEQAAEQYVVGALRRRLGWYRRDLRRNGLFGTRASVDGRDENALSTEGRLRRRELLEELWQSLDLEALLGYAANADLVQFCSAETLVLLNQDPACARMTRFAPATQAAATAPGDIIRTGSMLMAGVLRLVPLRTGTVAFGDVDGAAPSRVEARTLASTGPGA
jgi:hypothetical protein